MCFSASASFLASALTGAIGLASTRRVRVPQDRLLAAMPLVFSAQQAVEGCLWLTLNHNDAFGLSAILAVLFVVIAQIIWPVYAPLAVLMAEPDKQRRPWLIGALLIGAGLSLYLLSRFSGGLPTASLSEGHIVYSTSFAHPATMILLYLIATGGALMASSHRPVFWLGLVVTFGSAVSSLFYYEAYVSVWCFFAAISSAVILLHFERSARLHDSSLAISR